MTGLLDGKVAIVTGAAKGIGRAIAAKLDGAGASVVLADIDSGGAEAAAAPLQRATSATCDVRDEGQVAALVGDAVERHGRLDVMVAAAGIATVRRSCR
jgi:NAD(P)-dependent dehydrogenase (short-subunit alcohol dehydrogenase family)